MATGLTLAAPSADASTKTTVQVGVRLCAAPKKAGGESCYAMRLETKRVTAAQAKSLEAAGLARPATATTNLAFGPAGGYSWGQLAKAYGVNPAGATTQTVAIVDAFDDPSVIPDLNTFDATYGLPAEVTTGATSGQTIRVLNQTGGTTLPTTTDVGWAGEITLDVDAVRGMCHACKIILIEANSSHSADLAAGVNEAVTLGAKIVSNSYGGSELDPENTSAVKAAYDHHGVAILASTGDDGWYGWDKVNIGCPASCATTTDSVPAVPASYNTVVAVGGTSLSLNPDSTRAGETVWDDNGLYDLVGFNFGISFGASGGGCSTIYAPQLWQQKVSGYGTLGCGSTLRNGVDIAADADPLTGYDTYETTLGWCASGGTDGNGNTCPTSDPHWQTFGGTSLASPLIASMWALAGGPGGVTYPALSLYGHFKSASSSLYDVRIGGNGLCEHFSPGQCTGDVNPNGPSEALDCAWDTQGVSNATLANYGQCYASTGYDGVAGVGTPNGTTPFVAMNPTAAFTHSPTTVTHGITQTFKSTSTDPFPGGTIVKYVWSWGDGTSTTTTSSSTTHKYTAAATRTVKLTVTDNYGRTASKSVTLTVH